MDSIIELDYALFHLVNSRLKTGLLDVLMPLITDDTTLFFFTLFILIGLFALYRKRDLSGFAVLVALVLISDKLTETLKALIARPRPCLSFESMGGSVELLIGCSSSYSFPSGHATNIFAAMVFISLKYPKWAPLLIAIAFLVAYSRVYVGVHYPADITVGGLVGTGLAFAAFYLEKYLKSFFCKSTEQGA